MDQSQTIAMEFQPIVTIVKLPRCPNCEGKHPLAYNPPLPAHECPECGGVAASPGQPIVEDAVFTAPPSPALIERLQGK